MDEHIRKFCLKMKMYKVECSSVYQCAMFQGYLQRFGIESEVKQGYCVIDDGKAGFCTHYWVQVAGDGGDPIDIMKHLSAMYRPHVANFKTELFLDPPPPGLERADDPKVVKENELQYESFTNNPKQFWKDAPMTIKRFKH